MIRTALACAAALAFATGDSAQCSMGSDSMSQSSGMSGISAKTGTKYKTMKKLGIKKKSMSKGSMSSGSMSDSTISNSSTPQ